MISYQSTWIGNSSYQEGLKIQENHLQRALSQKAGFFLGFEFQPVISLGKQGKAQNDILASEGQLSELGVEVVEVDRGGHATLHSPGQLVIYPVIPLKLAGLRLVDFIDKLQVCSELFLKSLGIDANQGKAPGLYTGNGKIAFFGLRILKGISQHGLSINISNDLALFNTIKSCGKEVEKFDRVINHCGPPGMEELFYRWSDCAAKIFGERQGSELTKESSINLF